MDRATHGQGGTPLHADGKRCHHHRCRCHFHNHPHGHHFHHQLQQQHMPHQVLVPHLGPGCALVPAASVPAAAACTRQYQLQESSPQARLRISTSRIRASCSRMHAAVPATGVLTSGQDVHRQHQLQLCRMQHAAGPPQEAPQLRLEVCPLHQLLC